MASKHDLNQLFETLLTFIRSNPEPINSDKEIEEQVRLFCESPLFTAKRFTLEDQEHIALRLKRTEGVSMRIGSLVTDQSEDFVEWLPQAKNDTPKNYWSDYRRQLASQHGFTSNVLFCLDEVTDRILSKCSDPLSSKSSSRKGMVVGSVQSGKTANYIGLLTKAADYGYKVIIVIAGIHENLRSQTQRRINQGFIGQDTSALTSKGLVQVGVGVTRDASTLTPGAFTQEKFDFDSTKANGCPYVLDSNLERPVIFVIKKNYNILSNLLQWLTSSGGIGESGKIELPLLLIDDEADNASINIAYRKDEISAINKSIRKVLDCFKISAYIGYTATPFANIFIDPDSSDEMNRQDLFPRDFIVGLEPPSSYIGPMSIFVDSAGDSCKTLIEVNDYQDCIPLKHKKSLEPLLPSSLVAAINCFILSDSIKHLRGLYEGRNSSMLVNVSYFKDVHTRLKFLIAEVVEATTQAVRASCALDEANDGVVMKRLRRCFEELYPSVDESWTDVRKELLSTCQRIKVVTVNSSRSSVDGLAYDKESGSSLIAIGGFSLSRGLTLDGLTVSYFLRSSVMYDTLLQMGRWFGYRPGYEDLCRIWMTREASEWYSHIAIADDELRNDLATLERSRLTPLDFGLKVLSHPDSLLVTARNKQGSSEKIRHSVSLSDRLIETVDIEAAKEVLESNYSAISNLILASFNNSLNMKPICMSHNGMYGFLIRDVSVEHVKRMIANFNSLSPMTRDPRPILEYINQRRETEMAEWDLFIPSPMRQTSARSSFCGDTIVHQKRTCILKNVDGQSYMSLSSRGKVAGRGLEKVGLDKETTLRCEASWQEYNVGRPLSSIPDKAYRFQGRTPLIAVHLLDVSESLHDRSDLTQIDLPVTAWSISFQPTSHAEDKVEYLVNKSWLRMLDFGIDNDENEGIIDDIDA